uniref:uncharacterized protein LOC122585792 n=1 Tax=Erigeron canadensis TaxID=72917 RepID=UPI001CB9204B|nr:uncharacterized protein LOC122585792 [Erigeron canadensis]
MSFIPSFFVLQTTPTSQYLSSGASGNLHWNGGFSTPGSMFAAEPSQRVSGAVHLRSNFNNRYWLPHQVGNRVVISATAVEAVDNTNDARCTLFAFVRHVTGWDSRVTYSFRVLNTRYSAPVFADPGGVTISWQATFFHLVDWETLALLPSQISLVSVDRRDHWATAWMLRRVNYLWFDTGRDIGDLRVALEVRPTLEASTYRILSLHFGRFLRNNDWIVVDADNNNTTPATVFGVLSLGGGEFTIRSLSNNRFCTPNGNTPYLRANSLTMTNQTRFRILERVLERTISDIDYRLQDARIHQVQNLEVTTAFATNNTNTPDQMAVTFTIEDSRTTTFRSTHSVTLSVTTTLNVTIIPVILTGTIETRAEYNFTQEWEETRTRTTTRSLEYRVMVPPFSRRRVTLVCREASCDVPYNYTQHDLLPDGRRISIRKDDGVFHGVNTFDFDVESSEGFEDALGRMYV